jgi:hypothetical protein
MLPSGIDLHNQYLQCYRNGNKGVVMLHTTLEYVGVWDIIQIPSDCIQHEKGLFQMALFYYCVVVYQGCTPWFEARVGHLTGTTALRVIKSARFVLLDDLNLPPSAKELLKLLGLSLGRKSVPRCNKLGVC